MEKNGAFLGLGFGLGSAQYEINYDSVFKSKNSIYNLNAKLGYKHFFNDYIGIRAYFSVGYSNNESSQSQSGDTHLLVPASQKIDFINYALNADILANAYSGGGCLALDSSLDLELALKP